MAGGALLPAIGEGMKRRDILGSAGAALLGTLATQAAAKQPAKASCAASKRKTFLFVHGAWHCSIHWGLVVEHLVAQGHVAVAIDLPGSGIKAAFPPHDAQALIHQPSALRDVRLSDYADTVVHALQGLAQDHSRTILVGHSFGGQSITLAAERAPDLVERLVYVTAFCPVQQAEGSANAYSMLPENGRSLIGPVMIGDPDAIGAYRLNVRSTDPAYLEQCRQAFYNDLPMEAFLRFASYLNADAPAKASGDDGRGTAARWGRVPRTFVRCTLDQALPIELQDRMIREADQSTRDNRFDVHTLESSHSPFASMPDKLAGILANL